MAFGTKVAFEAVREIAFGSITANYVAVGTALIDYTRVIGFNNSTDVDLYISFDGVTNQLRIAPNSFKLFDLTSNSVHDYGLFLSQNTTVFVKRVSGAPTVGNFWIEIMYGEGGK
jgi:hypothetical protein